MAKQRFTTRFDEEVLALAERLATSERRSVTSVFEVALLDYAKRDERLSESPIADKLTK